MTAWYVLTDETGVVMGPASRAADVFDALASGFGIGTPRLILAGFNPEGHWWDGAEFVPLPPRPGIWAAWNGQEWIDPRTTSDMQAALYAARATARQDKSVLLMAFVTMGLMDAADARVAARGEIPDRYQAAFGSLPQEAQDYAMILWPSDQIISRMNPIALLFAAVAEIEDDQLDAAFGVQVPT